MGRSRPPLAFFSFFAQFKDNFDLAYQEYNGMGGTYTDVKRDLKQLILTVT